MPIEDLLVPLCIVVGTLALVHFLRRRELRGPCVVSAACVGFYGVVLVATMSAHCLDILSRLWIGQGHDGRAFVYGFRAYGLLLLGVVLIRAGVKVLRAVACLARGEAAGRAAATAVAAVAPLIPIHGFFAIPLTVLGTLTCLVLIWPGAVGSGQVAEPALAEGNPGPRPAMV